MSTAAASRPAHPNINDMIWLHRDLAVAQKEYALAKQRAVEPFSEGDQAAETSAEVAKRSAEELLRRIKELKRRIKELNRPVARETKIPPDDLLESSRALVEMSEIDEGRDDKIRASQAKLAAHALMQFGPGNSTAQPQPARAAPSFQDSRLPDEWEIFHSRTDGRPYYRNRITREVTWDPPPPPGWEIHQSKTQGKAYYRNRLTGEVTWTRPTEPARPLPFGWEAHQCPTTGKMYYRNLYSNNTQYERPYLVAPFERKSGSIVHPPSVHAYEQRRGKHRGKHSPMADDEISPTASEIAEFEMHMENLELPSGNTPLPVPDNVMETQQLRELAELDKQEGEMRARTWAGGKSRIKSTHKKSLTKKRKSYKKSYRKPYRKSYKKSYKKSNKFRRSKRSKKLRRKLN